MREDQDGVKELVSILLDTNARPDERDDAAMYLGQYNDERALDALVRVASDPNEWDYILEVSGESVAMILARRNECRKDIIDGLYGVARTEALGYLEIEKPEWELRE